MGRIAYNSLSEFRQVLEASQWYVSEIFWKQYGYGSLPVSADPYLYEKDSRKIVCFLFFWEEGVEHLEVGYWSWMDLVKKMQVYVKENRFANLFWVKPSGPVVTYYDSAINYKREDASEVRWER